MSENGDILEKSDINRALECVYNIKDRLAAIDAELAKPMPHKSYLKEKTSSIFWDASCLNSMMGDTDEDIVK